jgi:hypothetical protein
MRSNRVDHSDTHLLDGVVERRSEADGAGSIIGALVVVSAAVALFGLLAATQTGGPVEPGRLGQVEVRFGDPFAVDWVDMEAGGGRAVPASQPLPMVATTEPCFGFGRLDWAEEDRQPTVAHCVDGADVDALAVDEVAVVRTIQAGSVTWHLLTFGSSPTDLAARSSASQASSALATYRSGPHLAVLTDHDINNFEIVWRSQNGTRYQISVSG